MDNKVYVVKCTDYRNVEDKIEELIAMMGGMTQFVSSKENIILKVNLLQPAKPEQAVTTHPDIVSAVAKIAKKEGAILMIADSPGTGYKYNETTLSDLYEKCGMFKAAKEAGIEVNFDTSSQPVSFPEGKLMKHFEVITPVAKADGVFNLCKLKTHLFMSMTGAVKNNFGVIPGLTKPGYHAKLNDKEHFANMLLDLSEYVSPRISIMDAVIGMEGEGPGAAGTPRQIGLLLASRNQLALDIVASEIIGLRREQNPILIAAEKRGLFPNRLEEVQIIGEDMSNLRIHDYKFPATIFEGTGFGKMPLLQSLAKPLYKSFFSQRPVVIKDKYIACGICVDSCPLKIIKIRGNKNKYAHIDNKSCIRCYCCHELCPKEAVELEAGFLYRMMGK